MDRQSYKRKDRQTYGWDRQTDRQIDILRAYIHTYIQTDRKTQRQTDRQTEKHKDRQTEKHKDRQTKRHKYRQT